jgi:hypothetical protein
MRRGIALALTMIFSWLLMAPLYSPDADASLPACCRRHGKHHCMMRMSEPPTGGPGLASVSEKCPYMPASTGAVYSAKFNPESSQQFFAEVVCHPAFAPQTQARFRLSFLRSHQKRGPPTLLV